MIQGISKHLTRASSAKNCWEAIATGGGSEVDPLFSSGSCIVSILRLWEQECKEENMPEPYCSTELGSDNNTSDIRQPTRETVLEEPKPPKQFREIETRYKCPNCNSSIENQSNRCVNCWSKIQWQNGAPEVAEENMKKDEKTPFINVQSRSSF